MAGKAVTLVKCACFLIEEWRNKVTDAVMGELPPLPLSPSDISKYSHAGAASHLFGPLHKLALSEELIGVPEKDAHFLLDQGDGDLWDRQVGHLSNDVSYTARPLHYHTRGAMGDCIVDSLQHTDG